MLQQIVEGNVCAHYRRFRGHVFYKLHDSANGVKCNQCEGGNSALLVVTNYRDGECTKSHDLCTFFESNKLNYRLQNCTKEEG